MSSFVQGRISTFGGTTRCSLFVTRPRDVALSGSWFTLIGLNAFNGLPDGERGEAVSLPFARAADSFAGGGFCTSTGLPSHPSNVDCGITSHLYQFIASQSEVDSVKLGGGFSRRFLGDGARASQHKLQPPETGRTQTQLLYWLREQWETAAPSRSNMSSMRTPIHSVRIGSPYLTYHQGRACDVQPKRCRFITEEP